MMTRFFLLVVLLFPFAVPSSLQAELLPIQMDGQFSDWESVQPLAVDSGNDGGSSGIDFHEVSVGNDQDYVYFRFDTSTEVQPDEGQQLRLYLDTDLNAGTGTPYGGLGAELVWEFGYRDGTFRVGSTTYNLTHADVGLLMGPTVSGTQFEVALRRDAVPAAGVNLFSGETFRFILRDAASGGDLFPNSGSLSYTMTPGSLEIPSLALSRETADHLRLATYNVENDGLFDGGVRDAALARIFQAIDPDIMVLCEVWDHSAAAVRQKVEQFLPSGANEQWYAVKRDAGNVLVSRFPILQAWEVYPGHRITAGLLDLGTEAPTDLLVLANHWRCCGADDLRQDEADAVIAFLRDAHTPGGVIDLPAGTPVLFGGDLNLVGWRQQLDTLVSGDIQDEAQFGPDEAPDWDGSPFVQPPTRHPDARVSYTWRNDDSYYYPGMLDFIFYTDSNLDLHRHFILDTRTMSSGSLSAAGLLVTDTETASDHDPRVADFTLSGGASAVPVAGPAWVRMLPNRPNPFNPRTTISFELDRSADCSLDVYDVRGGLVGHFPSRHFDAGLHQMVWNARSAGGLPVSSGVYQAVLTSRADSKVVRSTQTLTLLK